MAFKTNRHDAWEIFKDAKRAELVATRLPETLFFNQDRLVEFLSVGKAKDVDIQLQEIPDEQFILLERVINAYFFDGWEQSGWQVLKSERMRRFGRYA